MTTFKTNIQKLLVPISIVIAGIIIGVAIYLTNVDVKNSGAKSANDFIKESQKLAQVPEVTKKDHIRGSIDAPIILIDYSDTQCPFCKRYHENVQKVYNKYEKTGKVAWVYRHFPLTSIHKKAMKESEATECVAELGGNDAFWAFTDLIYKNTLSNDQLDHAKLPEFAKTVGVDVDKFNSCLQSGKYAESIKADMTLANKAGVRGTPHTFIKLNDEYIPLVDDNNGSLGAVSEELLTNIIDEMLKSL